MAAPPGVEMNDEERSALIAPDFAAADVEAPNRKGDPISPLETWRLQRAVWHQAMLHKARTKASG